MTTWAILAQAHFRDGSAFAACLPVVAFAVVVIVVLLVNLGWRSRFRQTLNRVATHLRGRVQYGSLFQDYDRVHFEHAELPAWLRFSRAGKNRHHTHVEFNWLGPRLRCEIYPEGFWSGLQKLLGMQDIEIGSHRFDREFVISGDDVPGIKLLLSADVQTAIFRLDGYVQGMHVRFGPSSLTVTCKTLISDFVRLVELVKLCRELCDAALATQAQGIDFLDDVGAAPLRIVARDAHCMICGEALLSDIVSCRRCKTLHHRECWSYSGGCSTYGCGEKKFVT